MERIIPENKCLLVLGSSNANLQDRVSNRSDIVPMQLLSPSFQFTQVPFFNAWGECGVSSLAIDPQNDSTVYVATSKCITRVDCGKPELTELDIGGLVDVHEISVSEEDLWIANTGNDEVIRYDLPSGRVSERIPLRQFASMAPPTLSPDEKVVDSFHCNQFFVDLDGRRSALVHNTEGRQILKRIAQKLLKTQGRGGILNLESGNVIPLNFKAPHSVRIYGDKYTVLNSGHFLLQVFDRNWNLLKKVDTQGFGRGAVVDSESRIYVTAISATRKRYFDIIPGGANVGNMILFFLLPGFELIHTEAVANVEQINNIYLIPDSLAGALGRIGESLPARQVP